MEKLKSPEVRFKNFNDEWSSKRLKDLGYCRSGVGFPENEQGSKQGIPFFKVSDMNSKCNSFELNKANNYVSELTVAVRKWTPFEVNVAIVFAKVGAALLLNRKRIVRYCFLIDNNLMAYIPNINWDACFAKNLFDTLNLSQFAQTGALPSLNAKDIEDYIVSIPIEKAEQEKISLFQNQIDQIISLAEEKLTQTQNLKKAMLEKMFPKAGSTQPEIRLKGFSGEWDVDTIGNVLQEVFRPVNLDNDTKYRLVTVKRRNGGIAERAILKGKDILVKSQFEVKAGDYVISKRQVVHGATGLVPHELDGSIVSNEYLVGQGTDKLNIEFFALLSTLPEMYKKFFLSSYGVDIEKLFFDVSDWKKREISLPCLAEQIQISKFFKQLDETLVLQQQQLQSLKNLKQAFLEKMFV